MNYKTGLMVLFWVFALQGCATMNADECLLSDWHAIGYEDGSKGMTADRLGKHRKACAKHGVAPDMEAYRAGRDEGLFEFCQPQNGFSLGTRGGQYNGVCPSGLDADFVDAYRAGRKLYDLESSIRSADNQIRYKRHAVDEIEDDITHHEAALIADATTSEDRVRLLGETKDLSEEKGTLEAEIIGLVHLRATRLQQLAVYRETLAYQYPY